MEEPETRIEKQIGRSPDARALSSIWTGEGWKRTVELYWVALSRREIDILRGLTADLDGGHVDVNGRENAGAGRVALLSFEISSVLAGP